MMLHDRRDTRHGTSISILVGHHGSHTYLVGDEARLRRWTGWGQYGHRVVDLVTH